MMLLVHEQSIWQWKLSCLVLCGVCYGYSIYYGCGLPSLWVQSLLFSLPGWVSQSFLTCLMLPLCSLHSHHKMKQYGHKGKAVEASAELLRYSHWNHRGDSITYSSWRSNFKDNFDWPPLF